MLDNDNIITTNVSEAVEKIPTDEKNYLQMLLYSVLPCTAATDQHTL